MEQIIDIYKYLPNKEQELFKELLDDILLGLKSIEKNKNKKSIKQNKIEEYNKKMINGLDNILKKEFKNINTLDFEKKIIEEFLGKNFTLNHKAIFLSIYKGERKEKNNILFTYRRDFVNLLNQNNLLYISKFNISKQYKLYKENGYFKELKPIIKIFEEIIENQKKDYGEQLINQDLEKLENIEKELELITFKQEDIIKLLNEFSNIDTKKIIYENHTLKYNGNFYSPRKNSNRDRFLEKFFTGKENKYHKKEIINYLEFDVGDFYNSKTLKSLLDLYKGLNKTIEKKLGIKNLFYLGKDEYKDYIYIKY